MKQTETKAVRPLRLAKIIDTCNTHMVGLFTYECQVHARGVVHSLARPVDTHARLTAHVFRPRALAL